MAPPYSSLAVCTVITKDWECICLSDTVGTLRTCYMRGFFTRALVRRRLGVPGTGSPRPCAVCACKNHSFSPCTPMTRCHPAPLHPWEATGEGVSAPARAAMRWSCPQAVSARERLHARGFRPLLFISIPGVTTLHSGKKHPGWIWTDAFGAVTISGSARAERGHGSSWAPTGLVLLPGTAAFGIHSAAYIGFL